jgi:hypothetical protein
MLHAAIINVPADYATIQEGINVATEGDTVFVSAGTYTENIEWPPTNGIQLIGENRSSTIIDGNEITSVIRFEEDLNGIIDSTTAINSFTIRNGSEIYGGGIFCHGVSPCLMNLIITDNSALGGGGFYCSWDSNPSFYNVIIENNIASTGGGISCSTPFSTIKLENVSIRYNTAYNIGGGIYNGYSNLIFSSDARCSIYSNTVSDSKGYGADIYYRYSAYDTIDLVVDTFTVMNPTGYYASPINMINFDIIHSVTNDLINTDVYVSINGDNTNSGISPNEPFKTIKYALSRTYSDSMNVNTIYLGSGVYSNSTNGENFPIKWSNFVNLVGDDTQQTILDAELSDRVMEFIKINNSNIQNITITNGFSYGSGSGIYCKDCTNLCFENINIHNNTGGAGGGLVSFGSIIHLVNVNITQNSASLDGGGIFNYCSCMFLNNVKISMNTSMYGGGFYIRNDQNSSFENVSIKNNTAQVAGGGIYFADTIYPILSSINRCNIYGNTIENSKGMGVDIFSEDCNTAAITVDTFSVITPTDYYCSPINNYTFDILHGYMDDLVDSDIYVSPDGDNANSGVSSDEPFKTITYALSRMYSDSISINTIHLGEGFYSDSTNGEVFPIRWSNYVNLSGCVDNETILDAMQTDRVMEFIGITEAMIQNITITGGLASSSGLASYGGGVYCLDSKPTFEKVNIVYNSADNGGGIVCSSSEIVLKNSIVAYNSGNYGIYNDSYNPENPILIYSDFYNNENGNFYGLNDSIGVNVMTNANGDSCDAFYNIQLDPLFVDPANNDYHLSWANYPIPDSTKSPCIDAGDPSSPPDPDGTIADMGAYYFDQGVSIDIPGNNPEDIISNFPNPAKNSTMLKYSLKQNSHVEISIFNLKGQLVSTLVNEDKPKGEHSVIYNTEKLNSGVYFYKLQTEDISEIKKLVVIQ